MTGRNIRCPFCGGEHPEDTEYCPVTGKALTASFLQIGKIVGGKYELLRLLGEGGVGFVYEARNVEVRNHVALKLLHGPMAETPEMRQRFIREAVAAAEIGHENIVNVFDKGVDQATGTIYLVMELLKGESLADRLKEEGVFDPAQAVDIVLQVCSALSAAHEKGIVHRNMKPANVFLAKVAGRRDFVKLLDFGIALVKELADGRALAETGVVPGTPSYMSPEQIAATSVIDSRTDVYSCGVMLYEALTGKVPFDAPSVHGVIYKIMNEEPPGLRSLNPRLGKEIEAVVLRAMSKEASRRFGSMAELAAALQPFGSGRVVFGRSTLMPFTAPVMETRTPAGRAEPASLPPPREPQQAQAAGSKAAGEGKRKKKGVSQFVIILIVLLPLVSVIALGALVVLNVFYLGKGRKGELELDPMGTKKTAAVIGKSDADAVQDATQAAVDAGPADAPSGETVLVKRTLEIVTDPVGAQVIADGKMLGTSPLVIETEKDDIIIEAELEGYELFRSTFEVGPGATKINIKMVTMEEEKEGAGEEEKESAKKQKKKKKKCDPRDPKCRSGRR